MYRALCDPHLIAGCERTSFFALLGLCVVFGFFGGVAGGHWHNVVFAVVLFTGREARARPRRQSGPAAPRSRGPKSSLRKGAARRASCEGVALMGSQKATSDILLYAEMLAPSVMRLKNGSLLTGFRIKGPDLESAPPEVWAASSAALNDALLTLDHGWTVHFETTRLPSSASRGGDFLESHLPAHRRRTPEDALFRDRAMAVPDAGAALVRAELDAPKAQGLAL